jgi:hypothetical protein
LYQVVVALGSKVGGWSAEMELEIYDKVL